MQKVLQKGGKAPCFTQTQGSSNPNSCPQTRAHHRVPPRELGQHWCSTWALRTALSWPNRMDLKKKLQGMDLQVDCLKKQINTQKRLGQTREIRNPRGGDWTKQGLQIKLSTCTRQIPHTGGFSTSGIRNPPLLLAWFPCGGRGASCSSPASPRYCPSAQGHLRLSLLSFRLFTFICWEVSFTQLEGQRWSLCGQALFAIIKRLLFSFWSFSPAPCPSRIQLSCSKGSMKL